MSALAERPLRSVLLLLVGVMLDGFGLPPVLLYATAEASHK